MKGIEKLDHLFETEKQLNFDRDFLSGWELYETWDEVRVGRTHIAPNDYLVKAEDVAYYNRAVGETDPLLVDVRHALEHSPTGNVIAHPCFLVSMLFYCLGPKGAGTWLRTPGARNPFQDIELHDSIYVGERISLAFTTVDRFIRRGKHYITNQNDFTGSGGALKVRAYGTLIVPSTREEVRRFVNA
jgi:acyl dehydratase